MTSYTCEVCGAPVITGTPVFVYDEEEAYGRAGFGVEYGELAVDDADNKYTSLNTESVYPYAEELLALAEEGTAGDLVIFYWYTTSDGTVYTLDDPSEDETITEIESYGAYAGYVYTYEYTYCVASLDDAGKEITDENGEVVYELVTASNTILFVVYSYAKDETTETYAWSCLVNHACASHLGEYDEKTGIYGTTTEGNAWGGWEKDSNGNPYVYAFSTHGNISFSTSARSAARPSRWRTPQKIPPLRVISSASRGTRIPRRAAMTIATRSKSTARTITPSRTT